MALGSTDFAKVWCLLNDLLGHFQYLYYTSNSTNFVQYSTNLRVTIKRIVQGLPLGGDHFQILNILT